MIGQRPVILNHIHILLVHVFNKGTLIEQSRALDTSKSYNRYLRFTTLIFCMVKELLIFN